MSSSQAPSPSVIVGTVVVSATLFEIVVPWGAARSACGVRPGILLLRVDRVRADLLSGSRALQRAFGLESPTAFGPVALYRRLNRLSLRVRHAASDSHSYS
jgi:hypothetical protein